ncbi:hypothetical protein SLEP1_g14319 [Rubroshorea leprosula]|uniref:Uncharacterized protein n=1 Tax=Rubroshorea leprosula TaxID=152421 RepID=A0AAV5IU85_9ROSI|nr:hypothetical protein SLEP1_g14319 [Rubroshorea leprosula]
MSGSVLDPPPTGFFCRDLWRFSWEAFSPIWLGTFGFLGLALSSNKSFSLLLEDLLDCFCLSVFSLGPNSLGLPKLRLDDLGNSGMSRAGEFGSLALLLVFESAEHYGKVM